MTKDSPTTEVLVATLLFCCCCCSSNQTFVRFVTALKSAWLQSRRTFNHALWRQDCGVGVLVQPFHSLGAFHVIFCCNFLAPLPLNLKSKMQKMNVMWQSSWPLWIASKSFDPTKNAAHFNFADAKLCNGWTMTNTVWSFFTNKIQMSKTQLSWLSEVENSVSIAVAMSIQLHKKKWHQEHAEKCGRSVISCATIKKLCFHCANGNFVAVI